MKNQMAKRIDMADKGCSCERGEPLRHHGFATGVATVPESTTPVSLDALGELLSRFRRWRSARMSEAV